MRSSEALNQQFGEKSSLVRSINDKKYEEMKDPINNITSENSSDRCNSLKNSLSKIKTERSETLEDLDISILINYLDEVLVEIGEYTHKLKIQLISQISKFQEKLITLN